MALVNLILTPLLLLVAFIAYRYWLTDFSQGFTAILLMLPGVYLFGMVKILFAYFGAKRKLWFNFSSAVLCLILILIFDLMLIPSLKGNGAAIANSIAYSCASIYLLQKFIRCSHLPWKDLFRWNFNQLKVALRLVVQK